MEVEKKNEKGIIVLAVILIVIILGLVSYICIDKFYLSNISNNNITEDNNDSNKSNSNESVLIDSAIVTEAMEIFKKIYISDSNLYANHNFDISEISNYDLIASALKNIDQSYIVSACVYDEPRKTVSFEMLNSILNKYILDKAITENTITTLKKESSYPLAQYEVADTGINLKENGLELYRSCGAIFQPNDFVNKKIVSAEKNDDYLYVYEKQAFARYSDNLDEDGYMLVDYYKDYNKSILAENDLESIEFRTPDGLIKENSTPNWDLYNTYKYTFKIVDNSYYFQSFELTNN